MIAEFFLSVKKEVTHVKENHAVRKAAKEAGVPLWKCAQQIGISEPTLIRWLRVPLSPEKERRIMEAIAALERGAG